MRDFNLIAEVVEYNTAEEVTNPDREDILVAGSQNVLIDRNHKVRSRNGYSRLGVANAALTPVRNGATWNTSTGVEYPVRAWDTNLEVYLTTVDGVDINAWTNIKITLDATKTPRFATWYDDSEVIDLLLFIQGDQNIYEWGGGVIVVASVTSTTITKQGTTTFAQNRFYGSRDKSLVNVRTGTEFTYTAGTDTLTLTGVSGDPTSEMVAGDILIQKPVTKANKPLTARTNDTIEVFQNQLVLGSFTDNQVFISQNDDYTDFSYSAPRIAGEGGLLTLDGPSGGIGTLGATLVAFAGRNSIFKATYSDVTIGSTIAETLAVDRVKTGIEQGSQAPDCVVPIGNALAYLSFEPALRLLDESQLSDQPTLKTLSNPIKPDFDAEDWTNAKGIWCKNRFLIAAQLSSKTYILETIETASGDTTRYWQPPQLLPVSAYVVIADALHGHSNAVAETYKMDDGYSDINSDDEKLPIAATGRYAYRTFKHRAILKNFDEYFVEGEITPAVTGEDGLQLTINYDYGGHTQIITKIIDGGDEDILEENVLGDSLGQVPLGQDPLGGIGSTPSDARKFAVDFEIAREDFLKIQAVFSTNGVDKYWSILAHGPNVAMSTRKNIVIKK